MNQDLAKHHCPTTAPSPAATARCARLLSAGIPRLRLGLLLCAALPIAGCGLAAAPCRVTPAGLKVVPVVGHAAATPTDACAGAIDP